jgi:hypothetical protein
VSYQKLHKEYATKGAGTNTKEKDYVRSRNENQSDRRLWNGWIPDDTSNPLRMKKPPSPILVG